MKGQITTADIHLERKVRNAWVDEAVAKDVVVSVRDDGALTDPDHILRRAVRDIYGKAAAKTKKVTDQVRRIKKVEFITGLDLGETQYDI